MLYFHDNGLSSREAFTLKAIYSGIIIVFEIPSGYMADILGRKKTLILGGILGFGGMLIYALFGGFWAFMIAEIALGLSQSFVSGSDSAMMYDSLKADNDENRYAMLEGRNTAIGNVSESGAAVLGGILAEISFSLPFMIQSAIAFVAIPAALTLIEPPSKRTGHETLKDTFKVVHDCLFNRKTLRYFLIFSSIIGACTLTMAWIYHPYLKVTLDVSLYQIGLIAALLNFTAAIFSASAHKVSNYFGINSTLYTLALGIPSCYFLIAYFNNIWSLLILVIFYILRGVATPVLKDLVNMHTPSEVRATVLSVRNFVIRAVFIFIAPAIGIITDKTDYVHAFAIVGTIFFVLAIGILHFKRRINIKG